MVNPPSLVELLMEAPDLTLTTSIVFISAQRCRSNELGKLSTNLFLNHLKRLFEKKRIMENSSHQEIRCIRLRESANSSNSLGISTWSIGEFSEIPASFFIFQMLELNSMIKSVREHQITAS